LSKLLTVEGLGLPAIVPHRGSLAVYVIVCRDFDTGGLMGTKVGISYDPANRMTEIHHKLRREGLDRFRLEMPLAITSVWAEVIERRVHAALDDQSLEGEWFGVEPGEAIAAVEAAWT
jgi:hypothetical protein